jgi:hypothetical protein
MLARASGYYREESEGKRRMLLRTAALLLGVLWLVEMSALIGLAMKVYFGFAFRVYDWMMQGFE